MYIESTGRVFVESKAIDLYVLQRLRAAEAASLASKRDAEGTAALAAQIPSSAELTERARQHLTQVLDLRDPPPRPWAPSSETDPTAIITTTPSHNSDINGLSYPYSFADGALLRDFLISCCEPTSRTEFISEYVLTQSSLSAAAAEGRYSASQVRGILTHYSIGGGALPPLVEDLLHRHTGGSRLRLVLRRRIGAAGGSDEGQADLRYYLVCDSQPFLASVVHRIPEHFDKVELSSTRSGGAYVFSHRDDDNTTAKADCDSCSQPTASPEAISRKVAALAAARSSTDAVRSSCGVQFRGMLEKAGSDVRTLLGKTNQGGKRGRLEEEEEDAHGSPGHDAKQRSRADLRLALLSYAAEGGGGASTTASMPVPTALQYFALVSVGHLRRVRRTLHSTLRVDVDCYYDFTSDVTATAVPNFTLKDGVQLRPYQRASLERFVQVSKRQHTDTSQERRNDTPEATQQSTATAHMTAHHGVVVLPCGAGKTLTGIAASAMVGKRTIVMCINVLSVLQWRDQFLKWTNLRPEQVTICTKDEKQIPGDVFITTYSMLTAKQKGDVRGPSMAQQSLNETTNERLLFGGGASASALASPAAPLSGVRGSGGGAYGIGGAGEEADDADDGRIGITDNAERQYLRELAEEAERDHQVKAKQRGDPSSRSTALDLVQMAGETDNGFRRRQVFREIEQTAWGMLVLDEVHVAPANCFQIVVDRVKHKCVIGLSATLLREDMKIDDLRFLVGPKLYEANWLELTHAGHLAPVMCAEVRCPLPPQLLAEYVASSSSPSSLKKANNNRNVTKKKGRGGSDDDSDEDWDARGSNSRKRNAAGDKDDDGHHHHHHLRNRSKQTNIECLNPFKLWCTQALVAFHESRSPPDKTIIFCDSKPAAHYYASILGVPLMVGETSDTERSNLLQHFVKNPAVNTIILSRVGDIALDLPEASVIIQVSGLFSSRRQEAQRLGRILRPKPPSSDSGMSFFYTLVSQDTDETKHSSSRQEWLRDQGYSYRLLPLSSVMQSYFRTYADPSSLLAGAGGMVRVPRPLVCVGCPKWYFSVPYVNIRLRSMLVGTATWSQGGIPTKPTEALKALFVTGPKSQLDADATSRWEKALSSDGSGGTGLLSDERIVALLPNGDHLRQLKEALHISHSGAAMLPPTLHHVVGVLSMVKGALHVAVVDVGISEEEGGIAYRWVPFSDRNATCIETGFVQGFHRQRRSGGDRAAARPKFGGAASGYAHRHHSPLKLLESEDSDILVRLTSEQGCVKPEKIGCDALGEASASAHPLLTNSLIRLRAKRSVEGDEAGPGHTRHHHHDVSGAVLFDRADVPTSHGMWATTLKTLNGTIPTSAATPPFGAAALEGASRSFIDGILSMADRALPLHHHPAEVAPEPPIRRSIFAKKKGDAATALPPTTTGVEEVLKGIFALCGKAVRKGLSAVTALLAPPPLDLPEEDGVHTPMGLDAAVMQGTTLRIRRGAEMAQVGYHERAPTGGGVGCVGDPIQQGASHHCIAGWSIGGDDTDDRRGCVGGWGSVPSCNGSVCIDHLLNHIVRQKKQVTA